MQKDIEKELGTQERFISRFQSLVQSDNCLSRIIDQLHCPIAIFKRGGAVCLANCTLMREADLQVEEIFGMKINFLNRVTDENYSILDAAEGVFYGKTALLRTLSYPLELFCRNDRFEVSDDYHSALLFPVPDSDGRIPFGVIMLIKSW